MDAMLADFPPEPEFAAELEGDAPRVAVVGRPNVGKSTLVNRLLGEDRMIVFDAPGTTRDAIEVPFERYGRRYLLVDTAGVRKRGRVFESVEKFSVVKTMQAIDRANVVILVVDAADVIADQDAHLAGYILERGRALVVAANKWDGLDDYARESAKRAIERKLGLAFARVHFVSALAGEGLRNLMTSVDEAYRAAMVKLPTRASRGRSSPRSSARPRRAPAWCARSALRAPGRAQSADHRRARLRARRRPGELPALPGGRLPAGVRPRRDAAAHRVPQRTEPLRAGIGPMAGRSGSGPAFVTFHNKCRSGHEQQGTTLTRPPS